MKKFAIIGGGISGISLAKIIATKAEVTVFEKCGKPGGLISCDIVNNFLYHKVGGHVFNSKNREVLDWFWQFFDRDSEFIKAKRKAKIFLNDLYIEYPIEDNLYMFQKNIVSKAIRELLINRKSEKPANFKQFLIENFGDTLYHLYFKPYNEKLWNVDLEQVPLEWLDGKLPMPDLENIIINNILREDEKNMVHSYFYYPKVNGSQFIIDRLAEDINCVLNFNADAVITDQEGKMFINDRGPFDKVVFTGDVRKLSGMLKNSPICIDIINKIKSLISNGTTNILCSCDKNDVSWLYIPEEKYKAHRIIYTGNFSGSNNGDNSSSSCVVEFSNFISETDAKEEFSKLPGNLKFIAYNYHPNSYVIQRKDTREVISQLKDELKQYNIYLLGRFAEWEYYNMDKAIEAAFVLTDELFL